MGVELSFSIGSVGVLEEILTALKKMGADQGALNGAGFLAGAYLSEILRREVGGEWVADGGVREGRRRDHLSGPAGAKVHLGP